MIKKARYIIPAAAALGFFAGFAAHRPGTMPGVVETADDAPESRRARRDGVGPTTGAAPAKAVVTLKSADTVDELLALDDAEDLYARLALWQLDAPVEEIAAFWAGYRQREKRDTEIIDLIFSQWTRTDPLAAIEAAKGSGHEGIPWWAWSIHDPDAAIAAARGASKEMTGYVMRAIGQFHPARAMQVMAENPDFAQWNGIEGIIGGLTRTDPEAALAFQRKHGRMHDTDAIEKLTRDDPHAALEWLRNEPRGNDSNSEAAFLRTLERETPERLAELAATTPSGELKWKLESAAFRHLAEGNPAEALSLARAADSPRIAAERFAVIGRGLVEENPGKALAIFQELFTACPDAGSRSMATRYPSGSSGGTSGVDGVQPFIDSLVAANAHEAMDAAARAGGEAGDLGPGDRSARASVARSWAGQDLAGFTGWLESQEAGPLHDNGSALVTGQLVNQGEFAQALDWSVGISDESDRLNTTQHAFERWRSSDPEAANQWLEQTSLPEDVQKYLERYRAAR